MIILDLKIISPLLAGVAKSITRVIDDHCGSQWFLAYNEDSFDPSMYLVRADSFEDAYDTFICDEQIVEFLEIDKTDLEEWMADPNNDPNNGTPEGYTFNDNGDIVCTESVKIYGPIADEVITERITTIRTYNQAHLLI